ncbi:penicillin-binding protein [Lentilactobacillus sp. SPB1-3]|uniref:Penicillin-binding protein n=1 Tax=Lentilactobacillus terminaliae TaxID=3003483 RepID=A0ACD5DDR4_9LACO|nr:penicillin-binding protein [Lentilactobacillus sp. SPB1-3]MCZ0977824.1 penicillin-binding protein [Lentilactobacillus sp. SPB1-3]
MNDSSNETEAELKAKQNRKKVGMTLFFCFILVFFTLGSRMLVIAVSKNVKNVNLSKRSEQLYTQTRTLKAKRGTIYDANGQPIAEDTSTYSMYAVLSKNQVGTDNKPMYVVNKQKTAKKLSKYIPMSQKQIYKALNPKDKDVFQVEFGSAGTNISVLTKEKIEALKLPGINFIQQQARSYPNGMFASNLIGLATAKGNGTNSLTGQMGIEKAFNSELSGKDGYRDGQYDIYGYRLPGRKQKEIPAQNGDNVYTTIDDHLQNLMETEMSAVQAEAHPVSMNAILMEAKTGKIVAVSQRPSFNSETLKGLNTAWTNNLVQDSFEPGSTMKIFTMSASIDSGNYDGNALYESGRYAIDGKIVPDWDPAGWGYITYNKGFALSSNVAMAHLEQQMGANTWRNYIKRFEFVENTDSGLDGETKGRVQFKYPIEQADTAFGQGIEVTAMQMMRALSGVANNGKMMKPYFVSKVTSANNKRVIKSYGPKVVGHPISASTAKKVRGHMEDVVYKSYGIGGDYKMKGYRVAAKTGTAQVSNGASGYASGDDSYLYSVAGMVPANNPKYVMYITMKQPKLTGTKTATQLMAEIFKPVLKRALQSSDGGNNVFVRTVPETEFKSVSEAKKMLTNKGFEVSVIGNGNLISKQSIVAGTKIKGDQRVILITNGDLKMPRIIGWQKDDVEQLCKLTGLKLEATGSGYADSQSIKTNGSIKQNQVLKVNFE